MLGGCVSTQVTGGEWLNTGDFEVIRIGFDGRSSTLDSAASVRLIVVIEGDGPAWPAPDRASGDPTPITSSALKVAQSFHRTGGGNANVIYLGRPCQYGGRYQGKPCAPRWWTSDRFHEEVIDAYDQLLDRVQAGSSTPLCLVGHSGGGVIALLIAGRRHDVGGVMTLGSPVAVDAWTRLHRLTSLPLAQGIARGVERLPGARQIHFLGDRDPVVPPEPLMTETAALVGSSRVILMKGISHSGPWHEEKQASGRGIGPLSIPVSAWCAERSL